LARKRDTVGQTYTCEHCHKEHSNEFSRTCKTCDQDRESGDLDLDAKLKDETCPDCGEPVEDACLASCTCARCEEGDLEADLDRAEYYADDRRGRHPVGRESYDDRQIDKSLLMCGACGAWHYRLRPLCVECEGV
jgi:hypothetical protein